MVEISTLYGHLRTLTKQWFYDKTEIDTQLSDVVRTSETTGLIKNDGTIDTNQYLTQHQDISGKANTADLHAVATSGDYTDLENTPSLATVATSGSYLDLQNIPETFAPSSHTHTKSDITDLSLTTSDVTDASAYTNLGTTANSTQATINTAIDTKIGSLLAIELIEVVATRPSASADTMNKLYLVAEESTATEDAYEIFVTVYDGTNYSWEKVDTARIDLSGYATVDHVHGNITNDGKIGSESGKVVVTTTGGTVTTSSWIDEVDSIVQALTTYGASL